jgi:hypothetical protein
MIKCSREEERRTDFLTDERQRREKCANMEFRNGTLKTNFRFSELNKNISEFPHCSELLKIQNFQITE